MSELEALWSRKTDAQLFEALACISDYNDRARDVIRAEGARRGIEPPARGAAPDDEVATVARLYRWYARCVALQWTIVAVLVVQPGFSGSAAGALLILMLLLVFLATTLALPILGSRLLAHVGADQPRGTVVLMFWPLFGLVALVGLRAMVTRWRRLHGVEI